MTAPQALIAYQPDFEFDTVPTRRAIAREPAQRNRAVLVQTTGVHAGRPRPITAKSSTIGRGRDCTIRVDDDALSRTHARIVRSAGEYVLEDAGSLNGCFVDDRRVERALLADGDRIRLGAHAMLRFQLVSDEEERALMRVYESGLRDPLTGLANRKELDERLREEFSFAQRHGTDLALILADLDRFKLVNDTHGHPAGDAVLKQAASIITATVRIEDVVARFGGEEFVIVARSVPLVGAAQLAERVRVAIERATIVFQRTPIRVTASLGVATLKCGGATMSALVGCADERLYRAKAMGRNRVVSD